MSMFDNYNNIPKDYLPSNRNKKKIKLAEYEKPYEDYDEEGKVVGYSWNYGDTLNLQIELSGEITIPDNSITYTVTGEHPTENTVGIINQKAYNLVDLISWTCTYIDGNKYTWTKDREFLYTSEGKDVFFSIQDYIADKTIRVTIYNVRHEKVYNINLPGSIILNIDIDSILSSKMKKGVYSLEVVVCDQDDNNYITAISDLQLNVR